MRLDSVITKDANGNNSMLQYFVYNDKGKEIKREYSYCLTLKKVDSQKS